MERPIRTQGVFVKPPGFAFMARCTVRTETPSLPATSFVVRSTGHPVRAYGWSFILEPPSFRQCGSKKGDRSVHVSWQYIAATMSRHAVAATAPHRDDFTMAHFLESVPMAWGLTVRGNLSWLIV